MPNQNQKPQNNTNDNIKDTVAVVTAAAATIFLAPVTLPALTTLALATGAGGTAGMLSRLRRTRAEDATSKRQRDDDNDKKDNPQPPIHNGDDEYPFHENDIDNAEEPQVNALNRPQPPIHRDAAEEVDQMMAITDMEVFINIFIQRTYNNRRTSAAKGVQTRFLKLGLPRNQSALLQNMITIGYNSREEAQRAAHLFWQIKTGAKKIEDLTYDQKILLKIPVLRGGADVPWWKDNNDDNDPDATTTPNDHNNDDDDDTDALYARCDENGDVPDFLIYGDNDVHLEIALDITASVPTYEIHNNTLDLLVSTETKVEVLKTDYIQVNYSLIEQKINANASTIISHDHVFVSNHTLESSSIYDETLVAKISMPIIGYASLALEG